MIISNNYQAEEKQFQSLVEQATNKLNADAKSRPEYYQTRSGVKLEDDVFEFLNLVAKGTPFENTILKISGHRFPDIVAKKYYGVEVKTTTGKAWTSTGSSIVESTRVENVERIFLLFGKLSEPIAFKVKPYEDCLSDIVVTHSPRYKIDMKLLKNETIFEKMNVDYDSFRKNEHSINLVKEYYKQTLKPGQNLWWVDSEPIDEQSVSPIVKMWNTLDVAEKTALQVKGFCWFPEIFSRRNTKYNQFALWLVTQRGVVATSLRDVFTAGGRMDIQTPNTIWENQPQIFFKMAELKEEITEELSNASADWVKEFWELDLNDKGSRLDVWIELIVNQIPDNKIEVTKMLDDIFKS